MADIRINALATTAASTASDDFVAVDGSANGTRKLNAYSPTFGGNLTVSGTGTSSFAGPVTGTSSTNGYQWTLTGSGIGGPSIALDATNATVANRYPGLTLYSGGTFQWGLQLRAGDGKFHIYDGVRGADALTVDVGPSSGVAGTTTVAGNLTVSGTGTSSVAGNLGVGTTSPDSYAARVLQINDTSVSTSSSIKLTNNTTGATKDDGFDLTVSGSNALLIQRENAYMAFYTNATETMRLFANGNLFVGASPVDGGQKLQVSGTGYFADVVEISKSAASTNLNALTLRNSAYNVGESTSIVLTHGTGSGKPVTSISSYLPGSNQSELVFYTSNTSAVSTEALRINGSQNATFAGTVIANKATTAFRIPTAETPASASATGTVGTITWDASYIYVCTAANTWKRVAIATWP